MTGRATTSLRSIPNPVRVTVVALLALNAWAFWPTLIEIAEKWLSDPQYSHGFLVPLFAAALLWQRADWALGIRWGFHALGLVFFSAAIILRSGNLLTYNLDWLEGASFVLGVAGVVALAGGWAALRWAWPAIGFLLFMLPLPYVIERQLGGELQALATRSSTALLQLAGLPAVAEGNVIHLRDRHLGVAEACSGLSMLLIFVALAVAFAAVVKRPLLDRAMLLASAVPIALAVNIVRITATGMLHVWVGSRVADLVYHDLAGWLMMPLALGLLWLEMRILTYVLVDETWSEPLPAPAGGAARPAASAAPAFGPTAQLRVSS